MIELKEIIKEKKKKKSFQSEKMGKEQMVICDDTEDDIWQLPVVTIFL